MKPRPITECRVLELGCAAGWNLIPLAHDLTNSRFLGVDSSRRQIADAQARDALVRSVQDACGSGAMAVKRDGKVLQNPDTDTLSGIVDRALDRLRRTGLLVG